MRVFWSLTCRCPRRTLQGPQWRTAGEVTPDDPDARGRRPGSPCRQQEEALPADPRAWRRVPLPHRGSQPRRPDRQP